MKIVVHTKSHFYFFLILTLSFSSLHCLAQEDDYNLKNAGDYNNYIMNEMAVAVQKNFEYISLNVHSDEFEIIDSKRMEVMQQIILSKEKIKVMPPLDGDTRLRDAAVETLGEYQHAFELDYKDVISLKKKSRDSFEAMEAYWKAEDKAEEKVNSATGKLRKAQQTYASKNNMKVADGKEDDETNIESVGSRECVPTAIPLWPFIHPAYGFITCFAGIIILLVSGVNLEILSYRKN